jgi:hypothetical protein
MPGCVLPARPVQTADGAPAVRKSVGIVLPFDSEPRDVRVFSPDGLAIRADISHQANGSSLTFSALEAYAVAVLEFDRLPAMDHLR